MQTEFKIGERVTRRCDACGRNLRFCMKLNNFYYFTCPFCFDKKKNPEAMYIFRKHDNEFIWLTKPT